MTRYARAKGSKSSNERKPEEATSWTEMKKSMMSKMSEEKCENQCPCEMTKIESKQKQTEWTALSDENLGGSVSLLKQYLIKQNKNKSELEEHRENKKKKRYMIEGGQKLIINEGEMKKEKKIITQESEEKLKKSPQRRKNHEDISLVPQKKKKKVESSNETVQQRSDAKLKRLHKNLGLKKGNYDGGGNTTQSLKKFKMKFQQKHKNVNEFSSTMEELIINGEKIEIVKFQGFYVTLEDAERLKKLRSEMKKEGIPKDKLEAAIKLERRRAEKALSRLKKNVCFHCRGRGHLVSGCPDLQERETAGTGICYKCGSTEHSAGECKVVRGSQFQFAECFICREQGHIARQCPDNPRGLYPQGGACRECGAVTHLRKDCPQVLSQKEEEAVTVGVRSERDLECLDEEIASREKQKSAKKKPQGNSAVKF